MVIRPAEPCSRPSAGGWGIGRARWGTGPATSLKGQLTPRGPPLLLDPFRCIAVSSPHSLLSQHLRAPWPSAPRHQGQARSSPSCDWRRGSERREVWVPLEPRSGCEAVVLPAWTPPAAGAAGAVPGPGGLPVLAALLCLAPAMWTVSSCTFCSFVEHPTSLCGGAGPQLLGALPPRPLGTHGVRLPTDIRLLECPLGPARCKPALDWGRRALGH